MSPGTPRARVALLLVVTFAAGAAAGVALDRRLGAPAATPTPVESERRDGRTTIERFADDLGLTAEQREAIAPVLEDVRIQMRDVFDRVRPEYRAIVDSARARIESFLTPAQVARYRELLESEERRETDERAARQGRQQDSTTESID